jgi:hypothetical protein
MAVLLTQEWDVVRGKEKEYEKFVENEFIPRSNEMGLRSVGGFYVEVGPGPRIISLKTADDVIDLLTVFFSKEFKALVVELEDFVTSYGNRVMLSIGKDINGGYKIQKGVWKYIQYYDIIPGQKENYKQFILEEYLPAMKEIDYLEVTSGWKVVLGGKSHIIGELTLESSVDIGRLLDDPVFQEATDKLRRRHVCNYSTRIIRTTERFQKPRWYRL